METTQRLSRAGRLPYVRGLDGLRAVAVSAVVVFHATATWLQGGFLGVDVFFALSGYLITSQLLAEWRQGGRIDLPAFWKRRARRILAALYVLLFVTLAFALFVQPGEVAVFRGDAVAALAYVANWYFIVHHQPYFEAVAHPSPLLHLWSLGVEEQFYLFWPVLLAPSLLVLRRWAVAPIIAATVGSTLLMALLYRPETDPSRVYYGTDTHAAGLLIGSLLAFYWTPGSRERPAETRAVGLARRVRSYAHNSLPIDAAGLGVLAALAGLFALANDSDSLLYRGGFTLVAAITAAGVVAVSHPRAALVAAALEWAPVRWLGRRSYSIYLWHWPVIVFTRPGAGMSFSGTSLLAIRIAATLALAELSFRLVEEPVRRGALAAPWRRVEEALWKRQWRWVAASGLLTAAGAALLSGLGFAVATAHVPPPPAYLAVKSIDTILRAPAAPAQPVPATASVSESETPASEESARASGTPAATLSVATEAATSTPSADARQPASARTPVSAGRVIAIGDSVMLGAVPQLAEDIDGVEVNAAVGRQVSDGIQLLQQLQASDLLGQAVIVELGSNGTFTREEFDQIMMVLGGVPRVVFVNVKVPRSWESSNNVVIARGVQRYPNARLVNWYDASANHPEYFQADAYHLRAEGAAAYAALIAAAVSGP